MPVVLSWRNPLDESPHFQERCILPYVAHKWTQNQTEGPLLCLHTQSNRYDLDFWTLVRSRRQIAICTHGHEHPHSFPEKE